MKFVSEGAHALTGYRFAELIDKGADVIKITFSSSLPTLSPQEAASIEKHLLERWEQP